MDMKLDQAKLKALREAKAWSQSHLAEASGISLRTIQRIEKSGAASPESVQSLCATFSIQVDDLCALDRRHEGSIPTAAGLLKQGISSLDIKATLVAAAIAFTIALIWSL